MELLFVFAKDKYAHALTWASNIRHDLVGTVSILTAPIRPDFTAFRWIFWAMKERLKDFLSHRYRFPIFDLSDRILNGFLKEFETKKFDYINGYTSSIVLFAKFLQQKTRFSKRFVQR